MGLSRSFNNKKLADLEVEEVKRYIVLPFCGVVFFEVEKLVVKLNLRPVC